MSLFALRMLENRQFSSLQEWATYTVVHESQEVSLGVCEGQLGAIPVAHVATNVNIGLSSLDSKSAVGDRLELWCEALPGVWEVRKDENDRNAKSDGDPVDC